MPNPTYWKDAERLLSETMALLERRDARTLNLITAKYMTLQKTLLADIEALSKITSPLEADIIMLADYKAILVDLKRETGKFYTAADKIISNGQAEFIEIALKSTQDIIGLSGISFNRLNPRALKWMVGNSIQGGRLSELLAKSYPATVDKITQTLIESIAKGRGTRATAKLITSDMDGVLWKALRISRTEMLNAHREAAREQMKTSGIVNEWEWSANPGACPFCVEKNGKRFPVDAVMETHPNCLCAPLPIVKF